jgi:hypothetical protein
MNRCIEILVKNQNEKVQLSWTHLVRFEDREAVAKEGGNLGFRGVQGVCGFTGVSGFIAKDGQTYRRQSVPRTEMPETLQFTVSFVDADLYQEFLALLRRVCPDVVGKVAISNTNPQPMPRLLRLKEEYKPILEKNRQESARRAEKISLLIECAKDLGARFDDCGYSIEPHDSIPSEAYEEYGPQVMTNALVKIMCRKETAIYQALDNAGLLQAYCPEEYRRGDAYSVNGGPMHSQPIEEVPVE